MEKINKLQDEFGDWHFHRFWKQFLLLNPNLSTNTLPKDYSFISTETIDLLLNTREICKVARKLRGETQSLDEHFFKEKENEEALELKVEVEKNLQINLSIFDIEKSIIKTNNKILKRCLANFEGNFNPKDQE